MASRGLVFFLLGLLCLSSSIEAVVNPEIVATLTSADISDTYFGGLISFDGAFLAISSLTAAVVYHCPTLQTCTTIASYPLELPTVHVVSPYVFLGDLATQKIYVLTCTSTACSDYDEVDTLFPEEILIAGTLSSLAFAGKETDSITFASCSTPPCEIVGTLDTDPLTTTASIAEISMSDSLLVVASTTWVKVYSGCPNSCTLIHTETVARASVGVSGKLVGIVDTASGFINVYNCAPACAPIASLQGSGTFTTLLNSISFKNNVLASSILKADASVSSTHIFTCTPSSCDLEASIEHSSAVAGNSNGLAINGNKLAIADPFANFLSGEVYLAYLNACPFNADYAHVTWDYSTPGELAQGTCVPGFAGTPLRMCFANGEWNRNVRQYCNRITCSEIEDEDSNAHFAQTSSLTWRAGTCSGGIIGPRPYRFCNADGTWGPVQRPCVVSSNKCQPEVFVRVSWPETSPGTFGQAICPLGGVATRYCDYNGNWATHLSTHCP